MGESWRRMLQGSHNMFFLLCTFVVIRVNSQWNSCALIENLPRWRGGARWGELYTARICIYPRLRLSVTARWQTRPRATMLRWGHSLRLHHILSFCLSAKKSCLRSLLLFPPVVNYHHPLIEELTSFYSHTKDTFCHLWLLRGTVGRPVGIPWRWDKTGKQRRPGNILLLFSGTFDSFAN